MKVTILGSFVLTLLSCCCSDKLEPPRKEEVISAVPMKQEVQQPPEPEFGIVLLGDTGTGEPDQVAVAKSIEKYCQTEKCSIGLLLGDNFYPKGVTDKNDPQFKTKFEDIYKDLKFKFYVAVGNHDKYGNKQAEAEYHSDHWEMGGLYYSIDGRWIDIYALDTNPNGFPAPFKGKEQRAWLSESLPKSLATWKIVFGHHPVYSSGFHGNSLVLGHYLKPMLKDNKVDFYISGHDHDKELIERDGTNFIVSGAGSKIRKVGSGKYTVFAKSSLGFAHLLLTKKTATISFIDEKGVVEFRKIYTKPDIEEKK